MVAKLKGKFLPKDYQLSLLSDEAILEAMMVSEKPWEDYHHRLSILPMVAMVNTISTLS